MLPPRTTDAEDAFIAGLMDAAASDIVEAAVASVEAGRPMLAARLVELLPAETDLSESPALARAQQAARFLLVAPVDRRGPIIAALEEALAAMKARHMDRARTRQRQRATAGTKKRQRRRKPRGTRG